MTMLKCQLCEKEIDDFGLEAEDVEDAESIVETGRCSDCYAEFGVAWPDRL